jgi:hypothetical protein
MRAMFTMMNNARINVGLQGVQLAERALQQAVAYAADRVQSARAGADSPAPVAIREHPDVRRMLMRMKAGTDAIRALCYYTAGQVDRATLGDATAKARVDLLTPLTKSYPTDLALEITSLNIQVHGGMGYIEETGAAQFFRDARIAPIYEGTNGIQAADLVGRKLNTSGGAVLRDHLSMMRGEAAGEAALTALIEACDTVAGWMLSASVDDRLAGSVAFQTMMAVATCGWLMTRQIAAVAGDDTPFGRARHAAARYYLDTHVVEARSLQSGAMAGAAALYALDGEGLSA